MRGSKSIAYNFGGNIYAAYVVLPSQAGLAPEDVKPAEFVDNPAAAAAFVAREVEGLADPAKLEALEDLYARLHTYYTEWYPNNENAVVEVYRRTLNQSPEPAAAEFEAERTRFFKLSDPDLPANQQLVVSQAYKIGGVKKDRKIDITYNPIPDAITAPQN
jgi:sulfonate transport system substrate-binding protein